MEVFEIRKDFVNGGPNLPGRSELESGDQSEPFVARSRGHFSAQICILQHSTDSFCLISDI